MTAPAVALLVAAAVVAAADWVAVARGARRAEYLCKPLVMVALIGLALAVEGPGGAERAWFVAALVASLAGDVFLMVPRDRFLAGLASFLVAHLAYGAGLVARGVTPGRAAVGLAAVAVALVAVGRPLTRGVAATAPALRGPVLAYMAVISTMVVAAAGTGDGVAVAGAALFYVSDALIGVTRFVRPHRWGRLAVMVTYHLGQALLVLSLLR